MVCLLLGRKVWEEGRSELSMLSMLNAERLIGSHAPAPRYIFRRIFAVPSASLPPFIIKLYPDSIYCGALVFHASRTLY